MTPIVDLPTEPKYTIKTVASQTGVRPVTLRAWERRHVVLEPYRGDNHYRLYSDRDVAILRWLKHKVDEGATISSAVSELRSMTSKSVWPEVMPPPPPPVQKPGGSSTPPEKHAQKMASALLRHDESLASRLLHDALANYKLLTVFMEIVAPAMRQIEDAWQLGKVGAEARRFANDYLRCRLHSLLQSFPSRQSNPLILVGGAPMEVRELDSLMLAVLLHSEGYRVEFLGPDINIEDLADYALYEQPALVILWANSDFTAREMRRAQEMLRRVRPNPIFAYAGRAFIDDPRLIKQIPGAYLGKDFDQSLEQARRMLQASQKPQVKRAG